MRKVLLSAVALAALSGSAFAADLPSRKSAPVYTAPESAYNWTGFYIGAEVGADMMNDKGLGFNNHQTNAMFGGIVGYNYQVNRNFVLGLEADGGGVSGNRYTTGNIGGAFNSYGNVASGSDYYADIRGRLGYAMDRALLYVAGGVAFGDVYSSYTNGMGLNSSVNSSRTGWTIGGGLEYAFTNNWIGRVEYRYTDLGKNTYNFANDYAGSFDRVSASSNQILVGVIYKFGAPAMAPVVAKY